jgi:hypothetical protein
MAINNKKNPAEGYDAVIVFDSAGNLEMVVPEEFYIDKDEPVRWLISPQGNEAKVDFGTTNDPIKWIDQTSDKIIQGQTRMSVKGGGFKYAVTAGNITIDPHIRIGKR